MQLEEIRSLEHLVEFIKANPFDEEVCLIEVLEGLIDEGVSVISCQDDEQQPQK